MIFSKAKRSEFVRKSEQNEGFFHRQNKNFVPSAKFPLQSAREANFDYLQLIILVREKNAKLEITVIRLIPSFRLAPTALSLKDKYKTTKFTPPF